MPRLPLTFALLLLFLLCTCAPDNGLRTYVLHDDLFSEGVVRAQAYYVAPHGVGDWINSINQDSLSFDEADQQFVVYETDRYHELNVPGFGMDSLHSEVPYRDWERRIDFIPENVNVIYNEGYERLTADIHSAVVRLGPDTVRLSIIHTTGKAFPWQRFKYDPKDYLMLQVPTQTNVRISLDQASVGPIGPQTVFRVGRRHYVLKSLSDDRRAVEVVPLEDHRGIPVTAELNLQYRKVPVRNAAGEEVFLRQEKGRPLLLYFNHLRARGGEDIKFIDSTYQALVDRDAASFDLAFINRFSLDIDLAKFHEEKDLTQPLYASTDKTCYGLNCHSTIPYYLLVGADGRILSYYGTYEDLKQQLEEGKGPVFGPVLSR